MPKMTKAQAKRAYQDIAKKAIKLFENGYITEKDMLAFAKITRANLKKMGYDVSFR